MARPANGAPKWPGKGYSVKNTPYGNVIVLNLLGRVGMDPSNCPFERTEQMLDELKAKYETKIAIIDFHAEATSEKIRRIARHFDGRVSLDRRHPYPCPNGR